MASIRIDFSNIEIQSITIGETITDALAAIKKEMDRRELSGRDLHRACEQRYKDGHTENLPSYQTVAKFLSGNGEMTKYETVTAIIGALGYEITGAAVFVEGDAIKVIKEARAQGLVLPRGVPFQKKKK